MLITGFEPFNGESINPSAELAVRVSQLRGYDSLVLPVEYGKAFEVFKEHYRKTPTRFVLMLGQAAGRPKISLERVALNFQDSSLADSAGVLATEKQIDSRCEKGALFSRLPLREIVHELCVQSETGALFEISSSAGTYVCNDLYFRVLQYIREESHGEGQEALFVHVPCLPEQVLMSPHLTRALSMSQMLTAIENLCVLLETRYERKSL